MAYSSITYSSNSSANGGKDYTYSFGAVSHNTDNIKVSIGGTTLTSSQYSVVQGTITLDTAPGGGSAPFDAALSSSNVLKVSRFTNRTTAEIVFSANSIIQDEDLNTSGDQGRYLALEAVDRANESMAIDESDSTQYDVQIDGADKRIFGVEDPTNANDAASKAYVDGVATGSGAGIVTETGTQVLTNKTITSPVINTGVSGSAILDSDSMSGASATTLSSSESIKAYVDATNELVEDTTPQLGGMLDVNGQSIGDGTLELLKFSETGSAVNEITIANAATGNAPTLSATGGDDNIDITLTPKGTGLVSMTGDLKVGGNDIQDSGGVVALTFDGSGNTNMSDKILQRPVVKDYAESVNAIGVTGSAETIDITSGNVVTATLDDNCTFTFSNPSASGKACSFTLILTQDGTGSRTVTWPVSVQWASSTAPTLSTGGSDVDIFTFITVDAGTTWFGFTAGLDMDI